MSVSRREFLVTVSAAGGMLAVLPALPMLDLKKLPVLSFHLDQPWMDVTGVGDAYVPPAGARGGAPLAALSEEELSRFYGFI
jgi:hypothetical protein